VSRWLRSVMGATSRASDVPPAEPCPQCGRLAVLDGSRERGVEFTEPLCYRCRQAALKELAVDNWDRAYERARANGWPD
jgi:hypothetical protein